MNDVLLNKQAAKNVLPERTTFSRVFFPTEDLYLTYKHYTIWFPFQTNVRNKSVKNDGARNSVIVKPH